MGGKKIKSMIHVRDGIVDFLHRTERFLQNADDSNGLQIRFRLEKLEVKWNEFEEVQTEIEEAEDREDNMEYHRQVREVFEEKYFQVRAGLASKLPLETSQLAQQTSDLAASTGSVANVHTYVRLPQINLPEFDGNFEKWLAFHDTFKALIDSSHELSDIQKFHYLRASLRGDALKIVDAFPMSDANYRVAWDSLVARFSNAYLLKKRHLNALFEYPKIRKESAVGIHELIDCFERNTKILDQLGETTSGWGAMLTHLMVSKLDDSTQKQWEEHVSGTDEPAFSELIDFLKRHTRVLDALIVDQHISSSNGPSSSNGSKFRPAKLLVNSATDATVLNCVVCSEQHFIARCPAFDELPVDRRLQLTNSKRLCSNCLGRNHLARDCPSKFRCKTCSKKHHTLLHPGFPGSGSATTPVTETATLAVAYPPSSSGDSVSGSPDTNSIPPISSNVAMGIANSHVFLLTVVLKVKDRWGRTHLARGLLDSGSQANLMTERLCQLLKLTRNDKHVEISGIGQARSQIAYEVSTVIGSRIMDFSIPMSFFVMGQVTNNHPSSTLPMANWKPPADMQLADPEFFLSGPIDLVMGSQFFYDFHLLDGDRLQIRKFDGTVPVFVNTVFGWVAAGESQWENVTSSVNCHLAMAESLDKNIEKFWTIEELPEKTPRTQEEDDCETHFQNTFSRDKNGRYIVRYPKKIGFHNMIGDSKAIALRRFQQLERRLNRDPDIRKRYDEFMKEYLELKHMKLIGTVEDAEEVARTACYLPHHPVFKESSSTTKLRVVFDGSAKTSTNFSLNEALLTGPVIQDDLLDIVIRFRKHSVALVADVEKMYRQILIHSEDTPLQRILWRFDPSEPIQVYELQTVTYGLSSSSFLATRVLKQLAEDVGNKYEHAAMAIAEDFYMDDFLSGADSIEKAKRLQHDVQAVMSEGGLPLRKWSSNKPAIFEDDNRSTEVPGPTTHHLGPGQKIKTLGVAWETGPDQLSIEVQDVKPDEQWTKRKVFSAIAQLYDPLGLVSPVVAWAKMRMQNLWLSSVGWDDPLSDDICSKWKEFYNQLPLLKSFKVARHVFGNNANDIQFHVFSDASEVGYGACMYARSSSIDGSIKMELISSKSRVAPIKRITLPRLELCAALLAAKLYARVSTALRMEGMRCFFWSDSTVTLHWIQALPNTWQCFVGNRTAEIQRLTHGHSWNHVTGADNPADCISRGMLPEEFLLNLSWRGGPSWLLKSEKHWPKQPTLEIPSDNVLEKRKTVAVIQSSAPKCSLFERFSSFWKLVRVTAYILRFVDHCRKKRAAKDVFLMVPELTASKRTLVKSAQLETFSNEIKAIKKGHPVSSQSPLKNLRLELDNNGILCVGGRLQLSDEEEHFKRPMILPSKHPLTRLIAKHYHELSHHSGPRMTLASIRQEFWPLRGKNLANFVCRKCLTCFRHRPAPVSQPIGQLPKARVTPSRPFAVTGVDYCGPIYIKPIHRRAAPRKAFIAVFICFATKAVHLEMVCDLSTDAFIATLRRFIARRGLPSEMHSDNGTNFRGASNALTEVYRILNDQKCKQKIIDECSRREIKWVFIPPRAPNFGGLWEAAVKTAKSSLLKTIGNSQLSYEDYATVLSQIEANMNSRPLTPLSEDPSEIDVLTPGHFLTGTSLAALPDPDYTNVPTNRLKHYQQLQQLVQQHWIRWRKEYLSEINSQRRKSSIPVNIDVGQLVLVQEDNKPSITWPLARIVATHPGRDGIIRVVTIKTAAGTYSRSVSRIYPLPYDENLRPPMIPDSASCEELKQ